MQKGLEHKGIIFRDCPIPKCQKQIIYLDLLVRCLEKVHDILIKYWDLMAMNSMVQSAKKSNLQQIPVPSLKLT